MTLGIRRRLVSPSTFVLVVAASLSPAALGQSLGPAFSADYSIRFLSPVPGVPPGEYGGITLAHNDPDTLLVVIDTFQPTAAIWSVGLTRDAQGRITGYAGNATFFASSPEADGGLRHEPGGVLLYTAWPSNLLGQIRPGSMAPDRTVDLGLLGVASSTGGLAVTPPGFPGPGKLRITTYDAPFHWCSADLVPDGLGTFDVANLSAPISVVAGCAGSGPTPESIIYVDTVYPNFDTQQVLVCNWDCQSVGAYPIDAAGDIVPTLRRQFIANLQTSGSARDPQSGAFLFSEYNANGIYIVESNVPLTLGTPYCTAQAVPNSTGSPATLSAAGSSTVLQNDVTLQAAGLPTQSFGFFVTSRSQGFVPNPAGSQGNLCLAGSIGRYVGPGQIQQSGSQGTFSLVLDLTQTPQPNGLVSVAQGETWNFQAWHRDSVGGMPTSNFSDGLEIGFL